jgi:hypothetical protein
MHKTLILSQKDILYEYQLNLTQVAITKQTSKQENIIWNMSTCEMMDDLNKHGMQANNCGEQIEYANV